MSREKSNTFPADTINSDSLKERLYLMKKQKLCEAALFQKPHAVAEALCCEKEDIISNLRSTERNIGVQAVIDLLDCAEKPTFASHECAKLGCEWLIRRAGVFSEDVINEGLKTNRWEYYSNVLMSLHCITFKTVTECVERFIQARQDEENRQLEEKNGETELQKLDAVLTQEIEKSERIENLEIQLEEVQARCEIERRFFLFFKDRREDEMTDRLALSPLRSA